jgi:hypothetical protein
MHPPRATDDRPVAAQQACCDILAFVCAGIQHDIVGAFSSSFGGDGRTCDTFPLNWPSLHKAGSSFVRDLHGEQKNTSPKRGVVVALETITTNDRGISCGKFWQWAFWLCRSQAVYKTISSAVWSALARGLHLPMLRAETWLRALFWAALQAQFATILTFADRATNHLTLQSIHHIRPNGRAARLAFCILRQGFWPALGIKKELAHV